MLKKLNLHTAMPIVLMVIAIVFFILFFIVKDLGGDYADISWRLTLTKVHLFTEWKMPYFTPGRAGGFHLAADAQDFIFSAYMGMALLLPNVVWAMKLTTLALSVFFFFGMREWLRLLGVADKTALLYGALITVSSGYWVYHMTQAGNLWAHGIAYGPWIMVCIEKLLINEKNARERFRLWLFLSGLLFLLINSGYYWLQTIIPIIAFRVMLEIVDWRKALKLRFLQLLGIAMCAGIGIILSLPRLAAVYEFQLKKFPRLGGEVSHMQVVGDNQAWLMAWLGSLFDGTIISETRHSLGMLGYFWDYTNFIGPFALVFIVIGIVMMRVKNTNKALVALLLAALFQLALTRSTHIGDFERLICPLYKQITWHWRGSAIVVFALVALLARGFQWAFTHHHQWIKRLAIAILAVHVMHLAYVHCSQIKFVLNPPLKTILTNDHPVQKPLMYHDAPALLGYLFGYGNESPKQLSFSHHLPILLEKTTGHFNIHDVRQLALPQANGGYYLTHQWPLWPKKDWVELERFINFKQVVEAPFYVSFLTVIGMMTWVAYIFLIILFCYRREKVIHA